jgi:hypothetical protein
MGKVIGNRIPASQFYYDKIGRIFLQDITSLRNGYNAFSQVWDDSCDAGFVITGEKDPTKELIFTLERTDLSVEGETMGWHFTVEPESAKRIGAPTMLTVLIVND